MTYQFTLRTKGYSIVFNGNPVHLNEALDTTIAFQLHPHLGGFTIHSDPTFLRVSDLERFLVYLEEHIEHLRIDPGYESYWFVPMELGFEALAHQGDILDSNDGTFAFSFFVAVMIPDEDEMYTRRVYVGGKTDVELSEVRDFMRRVQAMIKKLHQDDQNKAIE